MSRVPLRCRASALLLAGVLASITACGGTGRATNDTAGDAPGLIAPAATTATTIAPLPTAATSASITAAPATTATSSATAPAAAPTTVPPTTVLPTTAPAPVVLPVPAPAPSEHANEPEVLLGHVEIPKINLDVSFYEGISLTTLDRGPGHWPGSALPGDVGNVVLAGHRVSHSRPFRNIDRLVEGDEVLFTVGDTTYTYVVSSTEVVTPDKVDIITQTPARTATLFACHPPGSTQYRWVTHLTLQS